MGVCGPAALILMLEPCRAWPTVFRKPRLVREDRLVTENESVKDRWMCERGMMCGVELAGDRASDPLRVAGGGR